MEAGEPVAGDAHVDDEHAVGGDREADRVEEAQRGGVERRRRPRPRRGDALAQRIEPSRDAHPVGERAGDLARIAGQRDVDAVVDRRLERQRDQRRRLRLGEVLRLHAVEVRADREHDVGLVPQPPGGLDVRRQPDQAGMAGREQPAAP